MKAKITLFVVLILCAAISAAAQQERVKSKSNITNNRASAEQALAANEKLVWKSLVDKKYDDFAKFFAEDYEGVYDVGTATRADELEGVKIMTFNSAEVSNIKIRFIDDNSAIVTSTVKFMLTMPEGKPTPDNVRATTVWVKRGKDWLMMYHSHISIKTGM